MNIHGHKVPNAFKKNDLIRKTVASLVTVFFIFSGIPAPTSFGAEAKLIRDDQQQFVPVVKYDPSTGNAHMVNMSAMSATSVPSGAAIQEPSPLSAATPDATATQPVANITPSQEKKSTVSATHGDPLLSVSSTQVKVTIVKDSSNWITQGSGFTITNNEASAVGFQLRRNDDATYTNLDGTVSHTNGQGVGFYIASGGLWAGASITIPTYANNNLASGTYRGTYQVQAILLGGGYPLVSTVSYEIEVKNAPLLVPDGWTRMPGNEQMAFKVEDGVPMVMDLQTNVTRPMTIRDITPIPMPVGDTLIDEEGMLNYFADVTGFPVYGISLTPAVIDFAGRVRPVIQVAYILRTPRGNYFQSQGTLFFGLDGKLENAHELAPDIPVGQADITSPEVVVPANITVTEPSAGGVVTLRGTKAPNTSIWYSLDNGVTYQQLVASGSATSWVGNITLPVGTSTILVKAKTTKMILGVATTLSSVPVGLAPITYTAPTVSFPTVSATDPTKAGVVTLSGTRDAGASIWYSLDNGVTYKRLVVSGKATSWTGNITLPVGSSTILIQARKTVIVSGVKTTISSQTVSLDVTYTAPTVTRPVVKATEPTVSGLVTLSGTKDADTSIWYSLDNGVTYKRLVVSGKATSWIGKIILPVGSSTILIQARKTAIVSGVRTTISSSAVSLDVTYTAPTVATPTVNATVPTSRGVVTLSGTRDTATSMWYSLDNGVTYRRLIVSGRDTSWAARLILPAGISTILIQSRKTVYISGVRTIISSEPAAIVVKR